MAVAEGVGEYVGGGGDGGVENLDLYAALGELAGEYVHGVLGMAVNGGVGDHDALFLGSVGAPEQVLLEEIAEVAAPHEAVEGADIIKLKAGGLFEHGLHLRAVFADDIGVVAAGLVNVVGEEIDLVVEQMSVERAEGAESVGGEKYLVGGVIGHHDLRPVYHGRHDKGKLMTAGAEGVALFDNVVLKTVG